MQPIVQAEGKKLTTEEESARQTEESVKQTKQPLMQPLKQPVVQPKSIPPPKGGGGSALPRGEKITCKHLERLAIVYIRQSTPQQVIRHQESTQVQYRLRYRALDLGWPEDRIEIIDDDLGQSGASAEGRRGFQRLVAEVSLNHVGVIFGVEVSRLARSCCDWHQLLEVCALFGTLIADLDGIYDPSQYNDRLLLGLKGTMSEAELHILKQRMMQGKLNKARRGELVTQLPIGYVRRINGEVGFDPDEQVQAVVRLVFQKFEELGTIHAVLQYLVKHNVQMGVRARAGLGKGELEWHRCGHDTLREMLKNPLYAGAYAYGRRKVDPRRRIAGRPNTGKTVVAAQNCEVFLQDRFPAYISWEQYERNQEQMKRNRSVAESVGSVRQGTALLSGLLVCQKCGCRMCVHYGEGNNHHRYRCMQMLSHYGGGFCQSLDGPALDRFVTEQMLAMLKPASLNVSLEASRDLEKERQQVDNIWQKRLERARYESERAQRQYSSVEPENRLVARQLEREWEEKLSEQKKLEMEYERFLAQRPRLLSEQEREAIMHLAVDVPALWSDESTTVMEKKEILRQVIDRIMVDVVEKTERVKVDIHWAGGMISTLETVRPVAKMKQLSYYPQLIERIKHLAGQGLSADRIVEQLSQEEWRPPQRHEKFSPSSIAALMKRLGLTKSSSSSKNHSILAQDEWLVPDLARELNMPPETLYYWIRLGWVKTRQHEGTSTMKKWVIWADSKEIERLRQLRSEPVRNRLHRKWVEKTLTNGIIDRDDQFEGA
jgi:DNA invertase Pin-like site-specific DNA recombinase